MKWLILLGSLVFLAGCVRDPVVYRQVTVAPANPVAVYTYPQRSIPITTTTIDYF